MEFKPLLLKSRTCSEAYINFNFHLSKLRTSLQAYIVFNFHILESRTTLEVYVDLDFHISMSRTSLEVYIELLLGLLQVCNSNGCLNLIQFLTDLTSHAVRILARQVREYSSLQDHQSLPNDDPLRYHHTLDITEDSSIPPWKGSRPRILPFHACIITL
jgi:hypothetical protein